MKIIFVSTIGSLSDVDENVDVWDVGVDVDADHLALHVADLLHTFDLLLSSCCQSQRLLLLTLSIFEVRQFFFLVKSVVRLVMIDSTLALLN